MIQVESLAFMAVAVGMAYLHHLGVSTDALAGIFVGGALSTFIMSRDMRGLTRAAMLGVLGIAVLISGPLAEERAVWIAQALVFILCSSILLGYLIRSTFEILPRGRISGFLFSFSLELSALVLILTASVWKSGEHPAGLFIFLAGMPFVSAMLASIWLRKPKLLCSTSSTHKRRPIERSHGSATIRGR